MHNEKAHSAFSSNKARIDELITRLQRMSDNHFAVDFFDLDWGDVGDLKSLADKLEDATIGISNRVTQVGS
ncbi:MAG: hypothetical protein JKY49_15050 [Cohaesibacteraceae bacterium]|nr:hypothetical protein [Cohaesibacteraceae bacterium]MBL4876386.1 hypothetical protein [Cohaesibacteraceae bacterium]